MNCSTMTRLARSEGWNASRSANTLDAAVNSLMPLYGPWPQHATCTCTVENPAAPGEQSYICWANSDPAPIDGLIISYRSSAQVEEVVEVRAAGVGGDEYVGADVAVDAAHHVHPSAG
jgi:hypothetical protein